jgi:hypothetical protein
MLKRLLLGGLAGLPVLVAQAEERPDLKGFKRLRGSAIERLISGKEFGDGVHWRYEFHANRQLKSVSMGRRQELRWSVKNDTLCWGNATGLVCHQVWRFGSILQLQPDNGTPPLDGELKPI